MVVDRRPSDRSIRDPHRLVGDHASIGLRYTFFAGRHDHRKGATHYGDSVQPMVRLGGAEAAAAASTSPPTTGL